MAVNDDFKHYLLVFDHSKARLVQDTEYQDVDAALMAYEAAESVYDPEQFEVVLIGSDSLDTVRQTHANYFDGTAALTRALAGILRQWSDIPGPRVGVAK